MDLASPTLWATRWLCKVDYTYGLIRILLSDYLLPCIDLFPCPQGKKKAMATIATTTGTRNLLDLALPFQETRKRLIGSSPVCTCIYALHEDEIYSAWYIWWSILYLVFGHPLSLVKYIISGSGYSRSLLTPNRDLAPRIWAAQTPGSIYISIWLEWVILIEYLGWLEDWAFCEGESIYLCLGGAWTGFTSQGVHWGRFLSA